MSQPNLEDEVSACVALLRRLNEDETALGDLPRDVREALMAAAGRLSRPNRDELRQRNRLIKKARRQKVVRGDRAARGTTGIRVARKDTVFTAPPELSAPVDPTSVNLSTQLTQARPCYVCKTKFTQVHFFYDSMCPDCAEFNYRKRFQTAPMHGQVALITGARVKIGYHAALMMLKSGAEVIVTTRFPVDAAKRFAREPDFARWGDRLHVFGLDLRHTPSVELFCGFVERRFARLDHLINNAAQTVRRPPGFYKHLMEDELKPLTALSPEVQRILGAHHDCGARLGGGARGERGADESSTTPVTWHSHVGTSGIGPGVGLRQSAELSQVPFAIDDGVRAADVFPDGQLDADLQQVDLRATNSWRMALADVPTPEMLEVQLVNAVAPFVLCAKLTPLMRRDLTGQKHVVNVSAMEGKFTRFTKTDKHPHTNMAKAALNMLTLTSAKELIKDGIFMNAVDTGWVTDEDPAAISLAKQAMHDFQPPLDIVDGAARVMDPILDGILTGVHWSGKFLKDYKPTDW